MQRTILQVPLNKTLKLSAEQVALAQGFSSLQEVVRVFLAKFAGRKLEMTIQDSVVLSKKNEKRYLRMTKDFKNNKNVYTARNVKDLVRQLNENPLP